LRHRGGHLTDYRQGLGLGEPFALSTHDPIGTTDDPEQGTVQDQPAGGSTGPDKMHAVVDRPEQQSGELVDLDDRDNPVSRLVADRQIGLDESAEETIITFLTCKKRLQLR
jgi:hypothetical protein